jgi:hypothetical protein
MYALGMAWDRSPSEAVRAALRRAAGFLREQTFGPVRDPETGVVEGAVAVWRVPYVVGDDPEDPIYAKLGGAGLGLLAYSAAERAAPGSVPAELPEGLGRFILYMQEPDGRFTSRFFGGSGKDRSWQSLYYPGEAMLGLLHLHTADGEPRWLRAAARGMAYLARRRRGRERVPPDHWALLATRALWDHREAFSELGLVEADLLRHTGQICRRMVAEQVREPAHPYRHGAFDRAGRTCPAATRLEGLQAALEVLPAPPAASAEEAALRTAVASAVERGMAFLLRSQVREGPLAGAVPRRAVAVAPPSVRAGAEPDPRADEVRIDYVQHALSALIQYEARRGWTP